MCVCVCMCVCVFVCMHVCVCVCVMYSILFFFKKKKSGCQTSFHTCIYSYIPDFGTKLGVVIAVNRSRKQGFAYARNEPDVGLRA